VKGRTGVGSQEDRLIVACRSWDDFVQQLEAIPLPKRRGDVFERLTQLYLQTISEYASRLRNVWLLREVPPTVRTKLNLPGPDEGIDLVAQEHDGTYWAIQAKYRSHKERALTRDDLDSFSTLTFVHCRQIAFGLVTHTSLKPIRKRKLLGNIAELGLDKWIDLAPEQWTQFHAKLRRRKVTLTPRTPRPHQERAVTAARRHFRDGKASRGRLIMPCGTGKGLTAFWIAQELKGNSILVAVPSLALITQSLREWTREYLAHGLVPDWLCVCSDESTGRLDRDEFVGETYDLGIPATTDTAKIAAFLRRRSTKQRIVFTTYQSGHRLARAARAARFTFDLAILDEAHRTVGEKSKSFAALLHEKNAKVKHRLFMTATERALKGDSDEVLSMDDAKVYGKRFYQLTFKDAIAERLISDYRILTVTVSDQRLQELIEKRRFVNVGRTLTAADSQALAAGVALKRAVKNHGVRHAISFHRSIRAAQQFAEQQETLNGVRPLGPRMMSLHVSSKKSAGERANLIREFPTHRRSLLTNARCLTEGVDIPAVDCVLFANPKQSVVDIVQAAGRAMRRYWDKEVGYILLPLVVAEGLSIEEFADSTEFRQVARTITALSTQDERIAEQFRLIHGAERRAGKLVQFEGDGVGACRASKLATIRTGS
jgi:predicted helicase